RRYLSILPWHEGSCICFPVFSFVTGCDAKDYTTVRFEVIEEGGTSVIDDVVTENIETQGRDSLKATMALIAKGQ
ncbi:hypothetical protein RJJ63_04820, partial [Rhizobium hidalgonense]|nr:hypothetical protein [Rhizobium hidalgonense]